MDNKNRIRLFIVFLVIYSIHIAGYLSAYDAQDRTSPDYGGFSLLTAKGDLGYAFDLTTFAARIKDSFHNHIILFQSDPSTRENAGLYFPNGNLVFFLSSLPLLFFDDILSVFFIGPLFSLLFSCLLLRGIFIRQTGLGGRRQSFPVFQFFLCLLLLTSSPHYFNIPSALGLIQGAPFLPRDLGYIGRFPYMEFSVFLLLFWFDRLIRFSREPKPSNGILLGFSVAVLQYSYFYFWTSAAVYTPVFLALSKQNPKELLKKFIPCILTYALLTTPFWIKFLQFQALPFAGEYLARMGKQAQSGIVLNRYVIGFCLFFLIIDAAGSYWKDKNLKIGKRAGDVIKRSSAQIALAATVLFFLNIHLFTGYTVQPYHWMDTFYYPMMILIAMPYVARLSGALSTAAVKTLTLVIVMAALVTNIGFGQRWAGYFQFTRDERQVMEYAREHIAGKVYMSNSFNLIAALNVHKDMYSLVSGSNGMYTTDEEILARAISGFTAMGYTKEQFKNELKKGERYIADYKKKVVSLQYLPDERSAVPFPDNYYALRFLTTLTYYDYDQHRYRYTRELDAQIDSLYSRIREFEQFQPDYLIVYKGILAQGARLGEPWDIRFENDSFIIAGRGQ